MGVRSRSSAAVLVAIIGADLAGLHAARLLQSEGVRFCIMEARNRLGGRILSAGTIGRLLGNRALTRSRLNGKSGTQQAGCFALTA